ncbi:Probable transposable element [Penicillium roqueforti FM164]|uniref:Probable transposable element n=1 Tax=Penicillium roqueforti (strain FM164) TaxID=1365484 RepID=W6R9C6_PENRF|nr:Probable transposable element [Penicillium roqueforti FM164]
MVLIMVTSNCVRIGELICPVTQKNCSNSADIDSTDSREEPQGRRASHAPNFTGKELRRQTSSIKALLRTRSRSPPSPSDRALNQLVKGFRLTMQGAILLAKENKDLRAANEK